MKKIPPSGIPQEQLLEAIRKHKKLDIDWQKGKSWSMHYFRDKEHMQFIKDCYNLYFSENYVNPFALPGVQKMEKDVVEMTASLLHGKEDTVGTITSGGSESIFLSVYTYKSRAISKGKSIKGMEILAPVTIHPAFSKAASILGLTLKKVPLGDHFQPNLQKMEQMISKRTIMLIASAPAYPNGIIDPIQDIGLLAQKYKLPFHVDSCIGGFMLPWVEKLEDDFPVWDFRVTAVTSMSADLHKFAYGAKGSSVLLFKNIDYLKHQFYISTDWPGGIYASTTLPGTRPAGPIAAAWGSLNTLGEKGYLETAQELMQATKRFKDSLLEIPEIEIIGQPHMNVFAYRTNKNQPDIFVVADQMEKNGWTIDRQQLPSTIHLTVMKHNLPQLEAYINDLKVAIQFAKENPRASTEGNAAIYGLMARVPSRGLVKKNIRKLFEDLYSNKPSTEEDQESDTSSLAKVSPALRLVNRLLLWWERLWK